jgi:hypothetical protein
VSRAFVRGSKPQVDGKLGPVRVNRDELARRSGGHRWPIHQRPSTSRAVGGPIPRRNDQVLDRVARKAEVRNREQAPESGILRQDAPICIRDHDGMRRAGDPRACRLNLIGSRFRHLPPPSSEVQPYARSIYLRQTGCNRPNGRYAVSYRLPILNICSAPRWPDDRRVGVANRRHRTLVVERAQAVSFAEVPVLRMCCAGRQRSARQGRQRTLGRRRSRAGPPLPNTSRRRSLTAGPPASRRSAAGTRLGHPAAPSGRRPRERRSRPPGRRGSPRSLKRPARPVRS